jgi:hypothetical protein
MHELKTHFFTLTIEDSGMFSAFIDSTTGVSYLPQAVPAPILTIRVDGDDVSPTGLVWEKVGRSFRLTYPSFGITAEVAVSVKPTHVAFALVALTHQASVELITWGPYPTTIGETIGETVGVVRNQSFAIGIQALNAKTLGGMPNREDDVMPSYNIFDGGDYSDISSDLNESLLYRGDTAVAVSYGSQLQAYCRDRSKDRTISNWGHDKYLAPAYDDGGVVGSKVALFGCPASEVMHAMEAIEKAEGLPHPIINGQWAKTSRDATASYIILDFGEGTIDQAIALTRMSGLHYLYHSAPFETWGHFILKKDLFPNGWNGFKACVDKAARCDIKIGFHTLSNFTTTNDPYVTPNPDGRLAIIGDARLAKTIDATGKTLVIDDPAYFRKRTTLNTVVIGTELITYKRVSLTAPWRLLDCTRGAFDTEATSHVVGTGIGKLMDHPYRVFLTDANLAQEQARRIADFCNQTGAMQLSFDGLEGNWSTGMGQYGRNLFTLAWYESLSPELQGQIINDASNPGHFNWHMYTRMNWGEPWYAGFRESQTLYRLKNQFYYSRNLMPRMLGWFALRGDTSLEDAEWLLARAAGFDAGFALATSLDFDGDQILPDQEIQDQGRQSNMTAILQAIHVWETARMADVFPEHLKPALQDVSEEFHLEEISDSQWHLWPVHSLKNKLHAVKRTVVFDNPYKKQTLGFIIQNIGKTPLKSLVLTIGNLQVPLCPHPLQPGEILKHDGKESATLYDANWAVIRCLDSPLEQVIVEPGRQKVKLNWADRQAGQACKVEFRTLGKSVELEKQG